MGLVVLQVNENLRPFGRSGRNELRDIRLASSPVDLRTLSERRVKLLVGILVLKVDMERRVHIAVRSNNLNRRGHRSIPHEVTQCPSLADAGYGPTRAELVHDVGLPEPRGNRAGEPVEVQVLHRAESVVLVGDGTLLVVEVADLIGQVVEMLLEGLAD